MGPTPILMILRWENRISWLSFQSAFEIWYEDLGKPVTLACLKYTRLGLLCIAQEELKAEDN